MNETIEILPAIDIRGGRCVRLTQGDYERETVFDSDPADAARRWIEQGARRLHIVDLDGAREGRAVNADAVERIAALGAPLQVGGGVRDLETVSRYRALGAARIILGTAAIADAEFLRAALAERADDLVVSVDARGGKAALAGWTESSGRDAVEVAQQLEAAGVRRLIYTDIASDGMLGGHDEAAFAQLAEAVAIPVIAAGGIAEPAQIRRLREAGAAGVVLGRALYDGRLTLADALAAGAPQC